MQYIFILVSNVSVTENINPYYRNILCSDFYFCFNLTKSFNDSMTVVARTAAPHCPSGKKKDEINATECKISILTEWLMGWLVMCMVSYFHLSNTCQNTLERHHCWARTVVWYSIFASVSQLSWGYMGSLRNIALAKHPLFNCSLAIVTNTIVFLLI